MNIQFMVATKMLVNGLFNFTKQAGHLKIINATLKRLKKLGLIMC